MSEKENLMCETNIFKSNVGQVLVNMKRVNFKRDKGQSPKSTGTWGDINYIE